MGDLDGALSAFDESVTRFGGFTEPEVAVWVARALTLKGANLSLAGDIEESLATLDDVLARFGHYTEPEIVFLVASALGVKAFGLDVLGRREQAVAALDELITRFGEFTDPEVAAIVVAATTQRSAFIAALAAAPDQSGWVTHQDTAGGFIVSHPAEWQRDESDEGGDVVYSARSPQFNGLLVQRSALDVGTPAEEIREVAKLVQGGLEKRQSLNLRSCVTISSNSTAVARSDSTTTSSANPTS